MTDAEIEKRIDVLEAEIASLKRELNRERLYNGVPFLKITIPREMMVNKQYKHCNRRCLALNEQKHTCALGVLIKYHPDRFHKSDHNPRSACCRPMTKHEFNLANRINIRGV